MLCLHWLTMLFLQKIDFVNFGNYSDIRNIVKSKKFYPVFITGLSGNGKTLAVT